MEAIMSCPLCDLEQTTGQNISSEVKKFDCRRCGVFKIDEVTLEDIEDILREIRKPKYIISGYTREHKEAKQSPPVLNNQTIKFIANEAPKSPIDRIDKILINLANMSLYPGQDIAIEKQFDYPLGYCKNKVEFSYYMNHLKDSQLLRQLAADHFYLTVTGWNKVEYFRKSVAASDQVFVAMNFAEEFDLVYENGIKKAIEATRYRPYRIDREEHADKIDDKILSEIKRSKFIIAEFTGQKHGVYFEAGYASGLRIPIIWTCRENDLENLHFDTRQYNHVIWSNEEDLKEKLINRIRVLIGENQ